MDVSLNQDDDNTSTTTESNQLNPTDTTTSVDTNNAASEFENIQFPDEIFPTDKDEPTTSTDQITITNKDSAIIDESTDDDRTEKNDDNSKLDVNDDNKMDYDFTSDLLGDMLTKATTETNMLTDETSTSLEFSNLEIGTNTNENKLETEDIEMTEIPENTETTENKPGEIDHNTNDNTETLEEKSEETVDENVDNTTDKTKESEVVEDANVDNVDQNQTDEITEIVNKEGNTDNDKDNNQTDETETIDKPKSVEEEKSDEVTDEDAVKVAEEISESTKENIENVEEETSDETVEHADEDEKIDEAKEILADNNQIDDDKLDKCENDETQEKTDDGSEKVETKDTEVGEPDDRDKIDNSTTTPEPSELGDSTDKIEESKEDKKDETKDNKEEDEEDKKDETKDNKEEDEEEEEEEEQDKIDEKKEDQDSTETGKNVEVKDTEIDENDEKSTDKKLEETEKPNKDSEDNEKSMDTDGVESKNLSENDDTSQDYNDDKDKDEQTNNIEYVELGNDIDDSKDSQMNSLENSENNEPEENPLLVDKDDQGIEQDQDMEQENEPEQEQPTDQETEENEQDSTPEKDTSNKDDATEDDSVASDEVITGLENADEALCMLPEQEAVPNEKDEAFLSRCELTPPPPKEYTVKTSNSDSLETCRQCKLKRKASFLVTRRSQENEKEYVCSDTCLDVFKKENEDNYFLEYNQIRIRNFTQKSEMASMQEERKCTFCKNKTYDEENNLTWELMDFCNEFCLWKYQKQVGSQCTTCSVEVPPNSLGKYCVRFGDDIRQFCSSNCLEEYKKGLKVCSYCQQDISKNTDDSFLAPVGDKGQFKDFCSQKCMEKYDMMTNNRPPKVDKDTRCSVCNNDNDITIEFETKDGQNYFCSDRCFVAFSFVNNIVASRCSMCRRYFPNEILRKRTVFYDNIQYNFCSNSCQNIYIIAHRKIVPCAWCKVKKYNFDMIRRYFKAGTVLNMCSIHCLNLFQVSINAVNSKKTLCNFCNKRHQPMYHLTMSDASIRNFCSYNCVMSFQNKFKKSPITLNNGNEETSYPVPAGEPKKNRKFALTEASVGKSVSSPPLPVISNVQSLAAKPPPNQNNSVNGRSKTTSTTTNQPHILNASVTTCDVPVKIKHHIIIKPAPVPEQRNVGVMCKVKALNKTTQFKPLIYDKAIQTDREVQKALVPCPVPVMLPSAAPFYCIPVPYPVAFPIPIPIPIFIPTTRNSAKGIMKEIKKIQVKIPTDPYEAELLMMAEMVAGDKKEENTDSESDVDDNGATAADEPSFSPEPVDASNTFGDDMLQMALKMATELEEPAVDLEGALTANTITASQTGEVQNDESVDDPQPLLNIPDRRGRKRGSRGGKQSTSSGSSSSSGKRRRISQPSEACVAVMPTQPVPPPEPAEKPDAHLCLKYTFGVNAWKQWVTTKNQAEMEKSSKFVKPFKTEILQLTADELNYSLCLFVKEVRKPNGAEYAPDTIYYLCLGIQQYLFENGRIDNIFCDPYYEQFTDSLDEVARKFSVLYNDSHYIVTRVEEEHLWESKQLGAHSPHVLLSTLMFFNTKHFNLTTVEEHMQLSFSHIMKHWKRNPNQSGVTRTPGSRNVLLRFYPPQSAMQNNARKKKVYEQQENEENPLRCPVKLYEFYLSKCPESVKTRNDVFYLQPERSCVPDSPVWYSTTALPREALEKMLHRVKMVKEINVALLTS